MIRAKKKDKTSITMKFIAWGWAKKFVVPEKVKLFQSFFFNNGGKNISVFLGKRLKRGKEGEMDRQMGKLAKMGTIYSSMTGQAQTPMRDQNPGFLNGV